MALLETLLLFVVKLAALCGGIAVVLILTLAGGLMLLFRMIVAKPRRRKRRKHARFGLRGAPTVGEQNTLRAELKALKAQMVEIQSTAYGYDLSAEAALTRLQERLERLETRIAALAGQGASERALPVSR